MVAISGWALLGSTRPDAIGSGGRIRLRSAGPVTAVEVTSDTLRSGGPCTGRFERIELDHVTTPADSPARLFDSNGAGVAAGDLDGDGLVDVVLANLDAPNTLLWNDGVVAGTPTFSAASMEDRSTRAVQLVDVDADGRLDIVTTHRGAGVRWWRNLGDRLFEAAPLRGVSDPAYAMAWADHDGDGDLDLATAAYDAELDQRLRSTFLFSDGAGVHVYTNRGDATFEAKRLASAAQALTVSWIDLDLDLVPELVVGNDFAVEDMVWRRTGSDWVAVTPFVNTAAHTMSMDTGDIDNDGVEEIFATDMKPTSTRTRVLAAWMPLIATMDGLDRPSGTQRIRNVLLVPRPDGTWVDRGDAAGVDAAGWAWSGRFGDLDNDGDLDLHIANGMIASETFPYLDNAELVETNVAFVNRGDGSYRENRSWGLDDDASGRGSVVVDVNDDGRLDVIVNNLSSPSTLFVNRTCDDEAIEFRLRDRSALNPFAIGAHVVVELGAKGDAVRSVRSGGGYLSGSPDVVHVGVGDARVVDATVVWPDGSTSSLPELTVGRRYEVTRPRKEAT